MPRKVEPSLDGFKECRRCLIRKPVEDFYLLPSSGDGLRSYCKVCTKAVTRAAVAKRECRCIDCDVLLTTANAIRCQPCYAAMAVRENHPNWKGGRSVAKDGYVVISGNVGHPRARGSANNVSEHTLVMESIIGRHLLPHETAHHKNGQRDDNRPENLELWSTHQPPGQRVSDKVAWAIELLRTYAPDELKGH